MTLRRRVAGLILSCGLLTAQSLAAAEPVVRHELSFPQRHNQYVHVDSTWPTQGAWLELSMPSWTPGSYLIRDFAAQVEGLRAVGEDGAARPVEKVSKNRWRIDTGDSPRVTVSYDVWAGELNVAASWVEAGGALLNGAGTFLYSEAARNLPQRLVLQLPADWPVVFSPLRAGGQSGMFEASDFDELVDSPIAAGSLDRHEFEVQGHPYALITPSGNIRWDGARAAEDIAAIVAAQQEFWDVNPFAREYQFFNYFMGPFGGLEHDHSTVMLCDPWQMSGRTSYVKWLGLVSHEFFHAWNVRRLRPQGLARYDYDREMYTRELWLAEGLTSYYDDLLLFRSGLIDVVDYLNLLAQEIRNYEVMPGRQVRSAEHASFDTWIKQYQPDENSINSTVSYYRKGALIGFVTDTRIRRETRSRRSLDDVMREMYRRYGPGGPGRGSYPPSAFEGVVEELAGAEVRRFVEDLLRTTDDPDVDAALEWFGLSLDRSSGPGAGEEAESSQRAGLGVIWDDASDRLVAQHVILGHAAAEAGMVPGDELLAIDGFRVTPGTFADRLARLASDQQVELTLVRHERLITVQAKLQQAIPDRYAIVVEDRMRRAEQDRLQAWLGRDLRFVR